MHVHLSAGPSAEMRPQALPSTPARTERPPSRVLPQCRWPVCSASAHAHSCCVSTAHGGAGLLGGSLSSGKPKPSPAEHVLTTKARSCAFHSYPCPVSRERKRKRVLSVATGRTEGLSRTPSPAPHGSSPEGPAAHRLAARQARSTPPGQPVAGAHIRTGSFPAPPGPHGPSTARCPAELRSC